MYYPDYMLDLAAAIARARAEPGEHRRAGPARTAGRHGVGASQRWAPSAVVVLAVLSIPYTLFAFQFGWVEGLRLFGLAVGLAVAGGVAAVVGLLALARLTVRRPRNAQTERLSADA